jgi:hypothetical protein
MQQIPTKKSYSTLNRNVLKLMADLIERNPTLRLPEILEKFNIVSVAESDKHTPPDTILARTYMRLHELSTANLQHI